MKKTSRIAAQRLVALARTAWDLADGTEGTPVKNDFGEKCLLVPLKLYNQLSKRLDALDKLPELPQPHFGTGPAKAEHALGLARLK